MAKFEIISAAAPYYTIRVTFGEQSFEQTIISNNTGAALDAQLQAYADEYASAWVPPVVIDETDAA